MLVHIWPYNGDSHQSNIFVVLNKYVVEAIRHNFYTSVCIIYVCICASICMAVEQRDVAELHNAPFERLIATQCCRLTVCLSFCSLTLSTHTDKIGARDEYIISLQMFMYRTFSLAKSTFRLESQFHRLFIHSFTDTIESLNSFN